MPYLSVPFFPSDRTLAQKLRGTTIMEATQSYPNLLSEKQAAQRLGIARITLLRAREAGRIRFFRIGTRVLYCAEQLTEFLNVCERNRPKSDGEAKSHAPRKENRVSSARGSVGDGERARSKSRSASRKGTSFSAVRVQSLAESGAIWLTRGVALRPLE
jgi:excisionase family DNA binding protein